VIFDGGDETPGLTVNFCYQNKRRKTRPSDLHEEVRFASDSSLEGDGFEGDSGRPETEKGRPVTREAQFRFARDSPLEERRFELSVPP
jgi:hypothetical protein